MLMYSSILIFSNSDGSVFPLLGVIERSDGFMTLRKTTSRLDQQNVFIKTEVETGAGMTTLYLSEI